MEEDNFVMAVHEFPPNSVGAWAVARMRNSPSAASAPWHGNSPPPMMPPPTMQRPIQQAGPPLRQRPHVNPLLCPEHDQAGSHMMTVYIPDASVSMFIGGKGGNIKRISELDNIYVSVGKKDDRILVDNAWVRPVIVKGPPEVVIQAVDVALSMLEEIRSEDFTIRNIDDGKCLAHPVRWLVTGGPDGMMAHYREQHPEFMQQRGQLSPPPAGHNFPPASMAPLMQGPSGSNNGSSMGPSPKQSIVGLASTAVSTPQGSQNGSAPGTPQAAGSPKAPSPSYTSDEGSTHRRMHSV